MKFALCAIITTIVFTGCTQLYTHRSDFAPSKRKGVWNTAYEARRDGTDKLESEPTHRPLFGTRRP